MKRKAAALDFMSAPPVPPARSRPPSGTSAAPVQPARVPAPASTRANPGSVPGRATDPGTQAPAGTRATELWPTHPPVQSVRVPGYERPDTRATELWLDRFRPTSRTDLCVHAKKLDEIAAWLGGVRGELELGLAPSKRVLILSGPTGCAKSSSLRVLAAEAGFEVLTWSPPRSLEPFEGQRSGWDGMEERKLAP
ncbi:Rad17 cell cycle checkpoint protein-domain-containing protein [Pavlovales sp. CCMP2436]|nr:Rad17 cell cycle checkpoint protein-domain-containing protein [Pavlovales sp. CCMP2436]